MEFQSLREESLPISQPTECDLQGFIVASLVAQDLSNQIAFSDIYVSKVRELGWTPGP